MIKSKIKLLLLFLLATYTLFAQNNKVTIIGTIKDKRNGETIIGATVRVIELSGTASNEYGLYYFLSPIKNHSHYKWSVKENKDQTSNEYK